MAIRTWPADTPTTVQCIVCHSTIPTIFATTGEQYANGQQAFACAKHLSRSERIAWHKAWAQFDADQKTFAETAAMYAEYSRETSV
ncbi:MAG TPA: hypothetical protein VJ836_04190 [Candidatus Saccharimonadales bacterium]|nr:hypothetical protein [Candidatus Saccharimonadales bacterium]